MGEAIGRRIKRERRVRGLTQRQVAGAVGVGVPHISKIESGRESPSDELLTRLAALFDIDSDELLLAAARMPGDLLEALATHPAEGLHHLRAWRDEVAHRDEWRRTRESLPVLRTMTAEEFDELFSDLDPATDDDIPWRFPVRVPLERRTT